jgi:sec-independent protein translocase protein TatC
MAEESEAGADLSAVGDEVDKMNEEYTVTESPRYDDDGPPDDQEMPLTDHIEEMVLRLAVVLAVAGVVTAVTFPFAQEPITTIWYGLLPDTVEVGGETVSTAPRVYGPLELKLMELKLASLAGLVAALPVGVYQTYRFMRPGLYPHERRYYLAAVPTSLVLAIVGLAFAYFVVLPAIFTYFLYYSTNAGDIAFALNQTFGLILVLSGFMALVFQIPLMIMLAVMMGVTSRRWLESNRLYFWAGFLGLSFVFNPDPTGMAPFLVTATMIVLYEGTLALLRWTGN